MSDADFGPAVQALLSWDEPELEEQIGMRAVAIRSQPSLAGEAAPRVTYDFKEMGAMDDVRELGRRILRRLEGELHQLLCGTDRADAADRESILSKLGAGDVALGAALATLLTGTFGLAPAVATVVTAVLIKRVFQPFGQEFCKFWGERLSTRR